MFISWGLLMFFMCLNWAHGCWKEDHRGEEPFLQPFRSTHMTRCWWSLGWNSFPL
jgi:hypothetical protein